MAASCRKPGCGERGVQGHGAWRGVPFLLLGRWGSRRCPSGPTGRGADRRHVGAGAGRLRPLVSARPSHPRAPARAASLSPSARPPASARWEGRRGLHKGRRGPQVGRAPGGGQAPESERDRVQLRATLAWARRGAAGGSLLSRGELSTPAPTPPLPRCEVTGPFRVSGERLAREEVEFFVPFPLALGEYLEVAGFFSNLL